MELADHNSNTLAGELVGELVRALGFRKDGFFKTISKPLVWKPMVRFTDLTIQFEKQVFRQGFQKAAGWFISHFVESVQVFGSGMVPKQDPLIIAANHPGAYDSLVLSANIPRNDIKIITSDIPFLKSFPFAVNHLIFADNDAHQRIGAVRSSIQHLREGGALLVFARGTIDPDPAFMPGTESELQRWSSSLGLFLRRVPKSKIMIAFISGILDPKFFYHPLTMLRKSRVDKQRISEFFQVIRQLLAPGRIMVSPTISFSPPFTLDDLGEHLEITEISSEIVRRAEVQYQAHLHHLHPPQSAV